MPVFLFYAIGYRYDFGTGGSGVVGTGGMYISAEATEIDMFLDDTFINDVRLFRNASYVQSIDVGTHQLHVQGDGLQTWVKKLPVYPHIVTEAQSFNMPLVPQVRLITPLVTEDDQSVVFVATTSEKILPFASTTNELYATTSIATSTYAVNPEYEFVLSLFASSTATSSTFVNRVVSEVEEAFQFESSPASSTATTATTTKIWRDVMLYEEDGEVYALWNGSLDAIPYYYCVDHESASSSMAQYGAHVYEVIQPILASSTGGNIIRQNDRTRVCRNEIRIDRKWQEVIDFDFFPDSIDLVLMQLTDGVYVVEVDDRAWQNTQLLYPGEDLKMVLEGGRIYVHDGKQYLEILTELLE